MPNVLNEFCKQLQTLPLNTPFLLKFKLDGIYKWIGGTDHVITLSCSNGSVSLTTKSVTIEEGWRFLTHIQSSSKGGATLEISVDGTLNTSISFKFLVSKDVFQKTKFDLLMSELKYIAPFVNEEPDLREPEYRGNYCMGAAERGLSELLDNDKNFYAVERITHKHKNSVSFSGKSAVDRGKYFQKLNYTEPLNIFNGYKINTAKKDLIYNSKDEDEAKRMYANVKYDIIEFAPAGKTRLTKIFEDDLKDKEVGFHVYYVAVTDGFHTLLLIIDTFSDPCNPKYEMWDQHGLTSSHGLLSDIAEGIKRQTSWTFANSCLNRYINKKTKYVDSTKTYLWKIKQK